MKRTIQCILILGIQISVGTAFADAPQWNCEGQLGRTRFSKTISLAGTSSPEVLAQDGDKVLSIGGDQNEVLLTLNRSSMIAVRGDALLFSDSNSQILAKCEKNR